MFGSKSSEEQSGVVEKLAHELGVTANATTIYSAPVERDGVTVIPVGQVAYGFGGGGGQEDGQRGSGGGGGVRVSPVGYIEIKDGSADFHTIITPRALLAALAAGTGLGIMAIYSISKLFRR